MPDPNGQHVHHYVVVRRVKRGDRIYIFSHCDNPGCPQPDILEIEYT